MNSGAIEADRRGNGLRYLERFRRHHQLLVAELLVQPGEQIALDFVAVELVEALAKANTGLSAHDQRQEGYVRPVDAAIDVLIVAG